MTKLNFGGSCKLPPGFRFQPTEEEMVFQYLAPKIFSCPLPAAVIPEIDDIFSFGPWDLPGESEKDKYFFSNDRESKNYGRRGSSSRATSCGGGYWRRIGLERQIISSKRMGLGIVGMKKTLLFSKGRRNSSSDHWIMHCYCISVPSTNIIQHKKQGCLIRIGKWDLCHIFLKKRSSKARVCNNDRLCRKYGDSMITVAEEVDADSSCASCTNDSDSDSVGSSEVSSSGSEPNSSQCT